MNRGGDALYGRGRRFAAGTWPNLPHDDLELAASADLFAFAMPVRRAGAHLVIS